MRRPIYLDYNATTPVAPEVLDAMLPYLGEHFGNPSSTHPCGRRVQEAVVHARRQVAALIGAQPAEIVFTGCATESNNLALLGVARSLRDRGRHLITSSVEHPAVAAPMAHLRDQGWEVTVLAVDEYGRVSPDDLAGALHGDTVLVSVMHANNEVGTLEPIAELAALERAHGVLFHTDAAQSVGKIAVDVDALGVDLLTIAGHKLYAAKGRGRSTSEPERPLPRYSLAPGTSRACGLAPRTCHISSGSARRGSWPSAGCPRAPTGCASGAMRCTDGSRLRFPVWP
jgi:cysteine desulfurase